MTGNKQKLVFCFKDWLAAKHKITIGKKWIKQRFYLEKLNSVESNQL